MNRQAGRPKCLAGLVCKTFHPAGIFYERVETARRKTAERTRYSFPGSWDRAAARPGAGRCWGHRATALGASRCPGDLAGPGKRQWGLSSGELLREDPRMREVPVTQDAHATAAGQSRSCSNSQTQTWAVVHTPPTLSFLMPSPERVLPMGGRLSSNWLLKVRSCASCSLAILERGSRGSHVPEDEAGSVCGSGLAEAP